MGRHRPPFTLLTLLATTLVLGGIALASGIPGPDGVITACYNQNGQLRVVESTSECRSGEQSLQWNRIPVPQHCPAGEYVSGIENDGTLACTPLPASDPPDPPDPDADGDGYPASTDCDDGDASVNPGASEVTGNNRDDDCDGTVDEWEDFDGVAPPALPSGWTTDDAGGGGPWITTDDTWTSSPNSAFLDDAPTPSDHRLISPRFTVPAADAQLTFNHNYAFETFAGDPCDGGVLEISIDDVPFTEFLAAGGSFDAGGYVGPIACPTNPLYGLPAWGGDSGGWITTVANFPDSAAGHEVRLRWRFGSDESIDERGWNLDDIVVGN